MILDIFLPLSLIFIMFSLGLGLTVQDFTRVIYYPKAFFVGAANQLIVLPVVAFVVATAFSLPGELAVGLMILSCCPGGVTSNIITRIAGGDTALSITYTAVISVVAVITLPIIVGVSVSQFMGSEAPEINIFTLGLTMFVVTVVPVALGLFMNTRYKMLSSAIFSLVSNISTFLFVVIVAGALFSEWGTFTDNIYSLGPAVICLIAVMLFVGYNSPKFFGLSSRHSVTIAIESGIQNATVGVAIGNMIQVQGQGLSAMSLPSGVYGILMYIVCLPVLLLLTYADKNRN